MTDQKQLSKKIPPCSGCCGTGILLDETEPPQPPITPEERP